MIGNKTSRYIVCQSPTKSTLEDFWEMAWQSGSEIIVCLVNPHQIEEAAPPYWPTKTNEKLTTQGYFIKMLSSTTTKFQTTSVLQIKCIRTGERRTIFHLNCADFADEGLPSSTESFLGFVDAIINLKRYIQNERIREKDLQEGKKRSRSVTRNNLIDVTNRNRSESNSGWKRRLRFSAAPEITHSESVESSGKHSEASCSSQSHTNGSSADLNNSNWYRTEEPPIICHCNDGAAESGVYLLVEAIIQSIEHNVEIDLPNVLKYLRQQRMYLIRNVQSYRFCYSLAENLLTRSRLI